MNFPMLTAVLPVSAPSEDDCARGVHSCEGQRIATSFGDGTSGQHEQWRIPAIRERPTVFSFARASAGRMKKPGETAGLS